MISVVIPVFNEQDNIPELYRRLSSVLESFEDEYEIVLVDDGSRDNTLLMLQELSSRDDRIRVLKLSRNFGHQAAMTAGIDRALGEIVVTMDGDLQDQPEHVPQLVANVNLGYDVAYAIRQHRQDSIKKKLASALFVYVMNRISTQEASIQSSVFMAMNRKVADALRQCREPARFLPGLVAWLGFSQIGVPVEHGARYAGESKYKFWSLVRLAINSITSFSYLPLRIASWAGMFLATLAFIMAGVVLIRALFLQISVEGYSSTIIAVLFIGGGQLLVLGILGEYIGRSYTVLQGRPIYIVDVEVVSGRSQPPALLVLPNGRAVTASGIHSEVGLPSDATQEGVDSVLASDGSALSRNNDTPSQVDGQVAIRRDDPARTR